MSVPKDIGATQKFNYFEPKRHKELEQKKDEWMKKTKDGMVIDFTKLMKMDGRNEERKANKEAGKGSRDYCRHDNKPPEAGDNKINKQPPSYNFPLKKNKLGYMNIHLQDFLNFDNESICYKNKEGEEKRNLKEDTPCLLRIGIENNIKQSFLYMLSNVYEFYDNDKYDTEEPKKNINNFKEYFIKNLTIDKFVSAQNGILPKLFVKNINGIDENKYSDSIYLRSISNNINGKKRIISAFENFKEYIHDENEEIDYKYIWDLVCKPINNGGVLFKDGINLLIFKEINDDMTSNKIEIICPMNYYSTNFFDEKKKTLMVITNGDFYEPLSLVQFKKPSTWKIKRFFSPYKTKKGEITMDWKYKSGGWKKVTLYNTISLIKADLMEYCQAKQSIKKSIYNYTTNISFKELKDTLSSNDKQVYIYQIINSNNKVIGGLYRYNERQEKSIYIPTHPSPIDTSIPMKYINDIQDSYLDYNTTKEKLEELKSMDPDPKYKNIPCKPISKISENGVIVGIKTETNQFVPVKPDINLGIPPDELEHEKVTIKNDKIKNSNEYILDEYVINNDIRDNEMLKVVKGIKLENNFYTMFRNTLKIMLSNKKYKDNKGEMIKLINDKTKTYIEKFADLKSKLTELLSTAIEFRRIELDILEDYDELISCFGIDDCPADPPDPPNVGCFLRKNICSLMLPKTNLFNSEDNEKLYYNKLTDELLRFQKIKNYIFTEREYLSFDNVNYKVNDNEIILLEGILLNTYLNNNLTLVKNNKYTADESIYDLIPPENIININWNEKTGRKFNYRDEGESKEEKSKTTEWKTTECGREITNEKEKSKLNIVFSNESNIKLYEYDYGKCKFEMIEKIIKNHLPDENISIDIIKNRLIEEHKKLVVPKHTTTLVKGYNTVKNNNSCKVLSLLYAINKKKEKFIEIEQDGNTDDIKNEIIKVHIMNDDYNITDFEIFLILKSYNISALIISPDMKGTVLDKKQKIFNTDIESDEYYVIVGRKKEKKGRKVCIYLHNNRMKINKSLMLNEELKKSVTNIEKYIKNSVKKMENKRIQTLAKETKQTSKKRATKIGKGKLPSE